VDLFERLKAAAAREWEAYVDHPFVRMMGEGTLPKPAFQTYLVQDYLFLIQFARAYALAIYKSRSFDEIRATQEGLQAIIKETELHVKLCARWGLSPADVEATPELQETVAYTRYVLDCGMSGDLLDLHVALSPCVIGYAEIGRKLAPKGLEALADHPYRDWIAEYAGEGYQSAAQAAREQLNRLGRRSMTEERFSELAGIFAKASLLEAAFWQMGLDNAHLAAG